MGNRLTHGSADGKKERTRKRKKVFLPLSERRKVGVTVDRHIVGRSADIGGS